MLKTKGRLFLHAALCSIVFAGRGALAAGAAEPDQSAFMRDQFPQPAGWPVITKSTKAAQPVGPGVRYERWHLITSDGPLRLSLCSVSLNDPFVSLVVRTQRDSIIGPGETLSAMADRSHAELGINADYYDIGASGMPLNVVMRDGRMLHQPDGAAALRVEGGGAISLGPLSWHARVIDASGSEPLEVSLINDWSAATPLSMLTPELGESAGYEASEIVLSPVVGEPGDYVVTGSAENLNRLLPLKSGELGLAAHGRAAAQLSAFRTGDAVKVEQALQPALSDIRQAVGGGPLLLRGGAAADDPAAPAPEETNVRYPLTGAGLSRSAKRLWLVVVDGRSPSVSIGMTRPMLASLFAALGAEDAMAFDSGGSSEMVVRALGERTVSVANLPSDGRERALADGLFVLNSAPVGPPRALVLHAQAPLVLAGSHMALRVGAIDAHMQPIGIEAAAVKFASAEPHVAKVAPGGLLSAAHPGSTAISAAYAGVRGELGVQVVAAVATINIEGYEGAVPVKAVLPLRADARSSAGRPIAVDAQQVHWSSDGGGGRVSAAGTFLAGAGPGSATVKARIGGRTAALKLLIGEHALLLAAAPQAGAGPEKWQFAASPRDLPGAVDNQPAPDGGAAMHLSYDFSGRYASKAAYAQSQIPLAGQPLAISAEVYGDGSGTWLRASYRNADGIVDSVTLARHVDWRGWKTMRADIPRKARMPITLTRLYLVEPRKDAQLQGDVWLRSLKVHYAGP
jgi:exopolysaccharide biosynthesis protein